MRCPNHQHTRVLKQQLPRIINQLMTLSKVNIKHEIQRQLPDKAIMKTSLELISKKFRPLPAAEILKIREKN